jgi:integrase
MKHIERLRKVVKLARKLEWINKNPIETVSKILGHTSIKTTQIYGRILDARISNVMMDLKSKLEIKNQLI